MLSPAVRIAPSFLPAGDFARLGEELRALEAAGADAIHLDVMDGVFVPNLTFGAPVIASLRPHSRLPFDAHLMVTDPIPLLPAFFAAGVDSVTVHLESANAASAVHSIRTAGKQAGLALRPATPVEALLPYLSQLDRILIMSVEPGFGGQAFQPAALDKLRTARALIAASGRAIALQVDGGMTPEVAKACSAAGADELVAGSAIYKNRDFAGNIAALRGGA